MSKQCCKYHDDMEIVDDGTVECAMSGKSRPLVCCINCPDNGYPVDMPIYYNTNVDYAEDRKYWEELHD